MKKALFGAGCVLVLIATITIIIKWAIGVHGESGPWALMWGVGLGMAVVSTMIKGKL